MDKITEELFTSLIKRVEANEEEIRKLKLVPKQQTNVGTQKQERRPGMASQDQLNFIAGLEKGLGIEGESEYAEMTKKEASDYISKLKAMKENNQKEGTEKQEYSEPEKKPLTPEEIAEIGEENLL